MPRSLRAQLWDIERATGDILTFTHGKQVAEYENDAMLRAAVERNFEVIGEALSQAIRYFPQIAGRVTNEQQIIAFRNRLIHGYATVSHALVWDIVQMNLPRLREGVAALLRNTCQRESAHNFAAAERFLRPLLAGRIADLAHSELVRLSVSQSMANSLSLAPFPFVGNS